MSDLQTFHAQVGILLDRLPKTLSVGATEQAMKVLEAWTQMEVADRDDQTLTHALEHMREHGSSVMVTWDEEAGEWGCSWITSGRRFTVFAHTPLAACVGAIERAQAAHR